MNPVVVDASVAVKWFVSDPAQEAHSDIALRLLASAVQGRLTLLQPPHFIAEVAAVLARLLPQSATENILDLLDLLGMQRDATQDATIYASAVELATTLDHHLFDTLYHALALQTPGAVLVTADRRYFDKARHLGRMVWLADFAA